METARPSGNSKQSRHLLRERGDRAELRAALRLAEQAESDRANFWICFARHAPGSRRINSRPSEGPKAIRAIVAMHVVQTAAD